MLNSDPITSTIIKCCYQVYNTLGCGFLEKVYENALAVEFRKTGIDFSKQTPINVYYSGEVVGEYFADFLVNSAIILELKAVKSLVPEHSAQLINYLNATRIPTGLLINFYGPKPEIKRLHFTPPV